MTASRADRVAARAGCVIAETVGPLSFGAFLQHYGGRGRWLLLIGGHITEYRHGKTPTHSLQMRLTVKAAYRITPKATDSQRGE